MNKWLVVVLVLLGLYTVGSAFVYFAFDNDLGDRIVVIPLQGEISSSGNRGYLQSSGISSTELIKVIKNLGSDKSVKGIIFEISSPGGGVVASQEIAEEIRNLNKTKYAVIREAGTSGAYWIASATDKIFASQMSITGSIGVYGSYLEFSGLFEKYGIDYERLVSGTYKDIGIPYKNLTDAEKKLFQSKLDKVYEYFIKEVAINRKMDIKKVREAATGEFYLGEEAKNLGLIDEFGNREKAVEVMKQSLNLTDISIVEYKPKVSLINKILGEVSYQAGRGFGSVFLANFELNNRVDIRA